MLTPRGKSPLLEAQRRVEPATLHHAKFCYIQAFILAEKNQSASSFYFVRQNFTKRFQAFIVTERNLQSAFRLIFWQKKILQNAFRFLF